MERTKLEVESLPQMGMRVLGVYSKGENVPLYQLSEGEDTNSNVFTVIIGRNGIGKSQLLNVICDMFSVFRIGEHYGGSRKLKESDKVNVELHFKVDEREVRVGGGWEGIESVKVDGEYMTSLKGVPVPTRVIAGSMSPFDKFPIRLKPHRPRCQPHNPRESIYVYIGSKEAEGYLNHKAMVCDIVTSLMYRIHSKTVDVPKLSEVFKLLGYQSRMEVVFKPAFPRTFLETIAATDNPRDLLTTDNLASPSHGKALHNLVFHLSQAPPRTNAIKGSLRKLAGLMEFEDHFSVALDLDNKDAVNGIELLIQADYLRHYELVELSSILLNKENITPASKIIMNYVAA